MNQRDMLAVIASVMLLTHADGASAQAEPVTSSNAEAPTVQSTPTMSPSSSPTFVLPSDQGAIFRYANTWDLNLEGGYGYAFGDADRGSVLLRARPGALFLRDDEAWQIGATAEWTSVGKRPAFGLQAEYLHIGFGTWIQVGASMDTAARFGGMAAVGFSVFGVEAQVRDVGFDSPVLALFGKVRIPVGMLVYALSHR